jgi:hypothetical protein
MEELCPKLTKMHQIKIKHSSKVDEYKAKGTQIEDPD